LDDFGTHTSTRPVCSASTIASATSLGWRFFRPRGVDDERHHVAEVDVGSHQPQLSAHGLGQANHRVLGGRIGGAAGRAVLAGLRGDVDDVPAIARDHPLQRQLHAGDDPVQVDVDHPPRGEIVLVDEAADLHDPGVVDEHVDRPKLLFGAVEEGGEGGPVGDVQRRGDRTGPELGGGPLGGRQIDVADGHPHPLTQQRLSARLADPARGAGDRRGLAGEDTGLSGHRPYLTTPHLRRAPRV
jgi:hypothetical protein